MAGNAKSVMVSSYSHSLSTESIRSLSLIDLKFIFWLSAETRPGHPTPTAPRQWDTETNGDWELNDLELNGDLELNDIEINGALVNMALGLTPTTATSPRAPTTTAPPRRVPTTNPPQLPPIFPLPPIRLSSLYNATLPLSNPPFLPRPPPPSRRRNGMIILIPTALPQELRDIQLDAAMTQDDDST
ncbi:hypothetical protein PtA15_7A510 [Puccinia triticina]|uniref:Uncharacterized protein n=1 Tax=Puccinia triticina TaxID=208348 RepID=A0ABY7CNF9_9BASI|nr:uncharacterized protein PtA15_7A510 [Puccinia triticina]WAQ86781.1 hypothetical protein PtA15_7A510 [Puccinia triticina]